MQRAENFGIVRRGKPEKACCFRDSGAPEPPNRYACAKASLCAFVSAFRTGWVLFSGCAGRRAERRRRHLWRAQRTKTGCTGHTPRSRFSVGFYGILAAVFRRIGLGGFSRFVLCPVGRTALRSTFPMAFGSVCAVPEKAPYKPRQLLSGTRWGYGHFSR